MRLTDEQLLAIYQENGGIVRQTPSSIHFCGFRNLKEPDEWNDSLYWFWINKAGKMTGKVTHNFTTEPGMTELNKPSNSKGVAILKEGFYPYMWKLGLHKGLYQALVQNYACSVYRDSNKDSVFNLKKETVEDGVFGINLHRAAQYSTVLKVGPYSAGCQVFRDTPTFNLMLVDILANIGLSGQITFPYCLIDNTDARYGY